MGRPQFGCVLQVVRHVTGLPSNFDRIKSDIIELKKEIDTISITVTYTYNIVTHTYTHCSPLVVGTKSVSSTLISIPLVK